MTSESQLGGTVSSLTQGSPRSWGSPSGHDLQAEWALMYLLQIAHSDEARVEMNHI